MGYRVLIVPPGRPPVQRTGVRKPRGIVRRPVASVVTAASAAAAAGSSPPSLEVVVALSRMRQPSLVSMTSTQSICTSDSGCASSDMLEYVDSASADPREALEALASSQITL